MLANFDHVTIAVDALDRAAERYEQLFAVAPAWRAEDPELGTCSAVFALANGCVELVGPLGEMPQADAMRALVRDQGEGVLGIAFGTPDAAQASARLRAQGVRATAPQAGTTRERSGLLRGFQTVELSRRDTRGIRIRLLERPDPNALRATEPPPAHAVHAIDHIVTRTADPDAAIEFYGNRLGLRLALDRQLGRVRMLFFRLGGVTIEVVHDARLGQDDAFYGVAYRVRDLAAAHARLQAAGFALNAPRDGNKRDTRVFSVRDGTSNVPTLLLHDPARDAPEAVASVATR